MPLYTPFYDKLCELLGPQWQPTSGYRSFDDQAQLYNKGRVWPGNIVTKAAPGLSFHNYGLATDWEYFVDGKYAPIGFRDPLWNEYIEACEKVGLVCLNWERPHNQYRTNIDIHLILDRYEKDGMVGVETLLKGEYHG